MYLHRNLYAFVVELMSPPPFCGHVVVALALTNLLRAVAGKQLLLRGGGVRGLGGPARWPAEMAETAGHVLSFETPQGVR